MIFPIANLRPISRAQPPHPGAVLRETAIPSCRASKTELARMLGITPQHLRAILSEQKPITPDLAAHLGKMFGNAPGAWIALQSRHDEWIATNAVDVSNTPNLSSVMLPVGGDGPTIFQTKSRAPDWLKAVCVFGVLFFVIGLLLIVVLPTFLLTFTLAGAGTAFVMLRRRRGRTMAEVWPHDR